MDGFNCNEYFEKNQIKSEFNFAKPNITKIVEIIDRMNNVKAGYDGIHIKVIKENVNVIAPIIVELINNIIETGEFPKAAKISIVQLLHKNGDKNKIENYRPISKLNIIAKIIDHYFTEQLEGYLFTEKIINSKQFGFTKRRGANDAVYEVNDFIKENLNNNLMVGALTIDLKKAFDSVDHSILVKKMQYLGIKNNNLKILNSYLSNRKEYYVLNKISNLPMEKVMGVPQGAPLSAICFKIFINDIFNCNMIQEKEKQILYADDIILLIANKSSDEIKRRLKEMYKNISKWCAYNKIEINNKKCEFIIFQSGYNKQDDNVIYELDVGSVKIVGKEYIKYLGVYFDRKINHSKHIEKLKKKLFPWILIFYKIRLYLNAEVKKKIYYSYVQGALLYAIDCWGAARKKDMESLFVLQKGLVKSLFGYDRMTDSEIIFKETNLLNLYNLRTYAGGIKMYKHLNNIRQLQMNFYVTQSGINYDFRRKNKEVTLKIELYNNNYGKKKTERMLGVIWNKIIEVIVIENRLEIKDIKTVGNFKIILKQMLMSKSIIDSRQFLI